MPAYRICGVTTDGIWYASQVYQFSQVAELVDASVMVKA